MRIVQAEATFNAYATNGVLTGDTFAKALDAADGIADGKIDGAGFEVVGQALGFSTEEAASLFAGFGGDINDKSSEISVDKILVAAAPYAASDGVNDSASWSEFSAFLRGDDINSLKTSHTALSPKMDGGITVLPAGSNPMPGINLPTVPYHLDVVQLPEMVVTADSLPSISGVGSGDIPIVSGFGHDGGGDDVAINIVGGKDNYAEFKGEYSVYDPVKNWFYKADGTRQNEAGFVAYPDDNRIYYYTPVYDRLGGALIPWEEFGPPAVFGVKPGSASLSQNPVSSNQSANTGDSSPTAPTGPSPQTISAAQNYSASFPQAVNSFKDGGKAFANAQSIFNLFVATKLKGSELLNATRDTISQEQKALNNTSEANIAAFNIGAISYDQYIANSDKIYQANLELNNALDALNNAEATYNNSIASGVSHQTAANITMAPIANAINGSSNVSYNILNSINNVIGAQSSEVKDLIGANAINAGNDVKIENGVVISSSNAIKADAAAISFFPAMTIGVLYDAAIESGILAAEVISGPVGIGIAATAALVVTGYNYLKNNLSNDPNNAAQHENEAMRIAGLTPDEWKLITDAYINYVKDHVVGATQGPDLSPTNPIIPPDNGNKPIDLGPNNTGGSPILDRDISDLIINNINHPEKGSVWEDITIVAPPATNRSPRNGDEFAPPGYFPEMLKIKVGDQEFFLTPSATYHLDHLVWSYAKNNSMRPETIEIAVQFELSSLQSRIAAAIANGIDYNNRIRIDNWEFGFSEPLTPGGLPVINHIVRKE